VAAGPTVALSLPVLLRTLGSGSDVTRRGRSQVAGWELTIAAGALLLGVPEPERAAGGTAGGAAPAGQRAVPADDGDAGGRVVGPVTAGDGGPGANPARTIDPILVSPGTVVAESPYPPGPDSDHPELMATIEWWGGRARQTPSVFESLRVSQGGDRDSSSLGGIYSVCIVSILQ